MTLRGKLVSLTPTEYRILSQLAQYPGRVLTHEELLSKVWGAAYKDETAPASGEYVAAARQDRAATAASPATSSAGPGLGYLLSKE